MSFAPHPDGVADPGEVVWTWVPYEEDHSRGKDRPVLVVGRDGDWLLALMLTSKDHDRDEAQEARAGRHWVDIGAGDWDRQGRPSEVRVDRVVRVDPSAVRRAGAALDRGTFELVEAAVRSRPGPPPARVEQRPPASALPSTGRSRQRGENARAAVTRWSPHPVPVE
jgi:hypothetical protein